METSRSVFLQDYVDTGLVVLAIGDAWPMMMSG